MDRILIDSAFRNVVGSHPQRAKNHFEFVDPGVWRYDIAGRLGGLGKEEANEE